MESVPQDKDKKNYCSSGTIYYFKECAKLLIIKKGPFYVIGLARHKIIIKKTNECKFKYIKLLCSKNVFFISFGLWHLPELFG
jgi:hypothetical protein